MENTEKLLPREKLLRLGVHSLDNVELLALILGSGTKGKSVFEVSREIVAQLSHKGSLPTLKELLRIGGLGKVKATQILACLELSGRYILSNKAVAVMTPEDLLSRIAYMKYEAQEHLVAVTLNSANNVINIHELTTGLVNQTPVHPREAFVKAIEDRAVAVIFVHNHPSGSTEPSEQDYAITKVLCAAGKIVQIPVIDHIIIGKCGFTSLCRETPELFEGCMRDF
jgi:DNA repair protein RadC